MTLRKLVVKFIHGRYGISETNQ